VIAETGGSIGIWHFFPSIDRYVDGLKEMAEIVGVDHVSIGTDQFDARGCVEDYTRWVQLVAAMRRGGFSPEEGRKGLVRPDSVQEGNEIRTLGPSRSQNAVGARFPETHAVRQQSRGARWRLLAL
jgi:hypothetical protein